MLEISPPHSVLFTPEKCISGQTPAKTLTINTLAELNRLPDYALDWCVKSNGSVSGIISYDAGLALQNINSRHKSDGPLAEVAFFSAEQAMAMDAKDLADKPLASAKSFELTGKFKSVVDYDTYCDQIHRIHQYEKAGDCYQVNFARAFEASYKGEPYNAFTQLVAEHPAPWASYMRTPSGAIFSCSPEAFLRVKQNRITTYPIKGSRPRGITPEADDQLKVELLNSSKDKAENLMIVDLQRNDLGQLCKPGSINVEKLFELQQFSNVQHLVSHISGELNEDINPLRALLQCFPGGSITGAPKKRSMEIIDELENLKRGYYCGSHFWLHPNGEMDSNILIRSFQASGGRIKCFGGGGIVVDSNAQSEFEESAFKVDKLMKALS